MYSESRNSFAEFRPNLADGNLIEFSGLAKGSAWKFLRISSPNLGERPETLLHTGVSRFRGTNIILSFYALPNYCQINKKARQGYCWAFGAIGFWRLMRKTSFSMVHDPKQSIQATRPCRSLSALNPGMKFSGFTMPLIDQSLNGISVEFSPEK